jgi:hypothetical protein
MDWILEKGARGVGCRIFRVDVPGEEICYGYILFFRVGKASIRIDAPGLASMKITLIPGSRLHLLVSRQVAFGCREGYFLLLMSDSCDQIFSL